MGSTSGIELGLAELFLSLGCTVTISGRSADKLGQRLKNPGKKVWWKPHIGALAYLTKAVAKEVEATPVKVWGLRPGTVATELITDQYASHPEGWRRSERVLKILSDWVETVIPRLAKRILANKKNGVNISWLTRSKIMMRFLISPFHKRQVFSSEAQIDSLSVLNVSLH